MQAYNVIDKILGCEHAELCRSFFSSIVTEPAAYKALVTRKAFNLFYAFYESGALENGSADNFISDNALMGKSHKIAKEYVRTGSFSQILIVDDILLHGRKLNSLLTRFTKLVLQEIQKDIELNEEFEKEIEKKLLRSIRICVIGRADKKILLYDRYWEHLESRQVWTARECHEFSYRVSNLLDDGYWANTSFVPTLYTSWKRKYFEERWREKIEESASEQGFYRTEPYGSKRNLQMWIRPLLDQHKNLVALYTVRIKQSRVGDRISVTPFFISKNFLCSKVLVEKASAVFDVPENTLKNYTEQQTAELLNFLMSEQILKLFCGIQKGDARRKCFKIDYDKMCWSLGREVTERKTGKEEIDSWEELDRLVSILTDDSMPALVYRNEVGQWNVNDFMEELSRRGEEAELQAFRQSERIEYPVGLNTNTIHFDRLLHSCGSDIMEVTQAVADILASMDRGEMSVSVDLEKNKNYLYLCQAGEGSMLIQAKKYRIYIPLLTAMENVCGKDPERIGRQLKSYFEMLHTENADEKAEKLKNYVGRLYESGQSVADWNLSFYRWIEPNEKNDEVQAEYKDNIHEEVLQYRLGQDYLNMKNRM